MSHHISKNKKKTKQNKKHTQIYVMQLQSEMTCKNKKENTLQNRASQTQQCLHKISKQL